MTRITIGAPNTAVTELIDSSLGANAVLAIRSHSRQNTAPPRKHPGIMTIGFAVLNRRRIRCGTATPTKLIGPANAVTHADSTPDSRISAARNALMFTPRFFAYTSPS